MRGLRWLVDQPAFKQRPATVTARLVAWRLRTWARRATTVDVHGCTMHLPPEWHGTARLIYAFRDHAEREGMQVISRFVTRDMTVVDVGAHYGLYTLALARAARRVIAIEPSPHALLVLKRNIAANGFDVEVHHCAVGAADREAVLHHDPKDTSRASTTIDRGGDRTTSVLVRTLDRLVASGSGFVKMDIEGGETDALLGAGQLLATHRPVLWIEVRPEDAPGGRPRGQRPWDILREYGYRFERMLPDGTTQAVTAHPTEVVNLIAVPD